MRTVKECPACGEDVLRNQQKYEEDDTYNVWMTSNGLQLYAIVCKDCFHVYKKEKQMSKDKMEMPTKEQILEAASDCPQAKDALAKLFPKAFEEDKKDRKYCCQWMKNAIEEVGAIIASDICFRIPQRAGKDNRVGEDLVYFCPRCGKNIG